MTSVALTRLVPDPAKVTVVAGLVPNQPPVIVTKVPTLPVVGVKEAKTGLPVKTNAEGILGPVDTVLALVPFAHSPEVFSPTEKAAAPLEISAE